MVEILPVAGINDICQINSTVKCRGENGKKDCPEGKRLITVKEYIRKDCKDRRDQVKIQVDVAEGAFVPRRRTEPYHDRHKGQPDGCGSGELEDPQSTGAWTLRLPEPYDTGKRDSQGSRSGQQIGVNGIVDQNVYAVSAVIFRAVEGKEKNRDQDQEKAGTVRNKRKP